MVDPMNRTITEMAEDTTTASRGVAMGLGQPKLFSVAPFANMV